MYKINSACFYDINPERVYDLPCMDNHKSFHGKAKIIECKEGRYLQSYNTLVCFLSYGGTFEKLWDGYSYIQSPLISFMIMYSVQIWR